VLELSIPNGHKQDVSPSIKDLLNKGKYPSSDNRTILDANSGVLIKPAVLILRLLLELAKQADFNGITPLEVVHALMPIKRNNEWALAINNLTGLRKRKGLERDGRRIRHIQEWFRLLSLTDIFDLSGQKIVLSRLALDNLRFVEKFCLQHEDERSFWIPETDNPEHLAISWFTHFGSPNIENQWAIGASSLTSAYVKQNYPEGVFDEQDLEEKKLSDLEISLVEFEEKRKPFEGRQDYEINAARIKEGRRKVQEKTKLHDEIVASLAKQLLDLNFTFTRTEILLTYWRLKIRLRQFSR